MSDIQVVDLFAGCGGLSLGFQNAGFKMLAAFDQWDKAVAIYNRNFDHPAFVRDLSACDNYQFIADYKPDMLIGGPPCQDFSSAGKRDETLGRANLTITFADIVADVGPQWFVMENVERIKTSRVLKTCKAILKQAGYGLTQVILNASLCGVPQHRKRFFLIGELNGPTNGLSAYLTKNLASEPMTLHDYFGDALGLTVYYRHPRSYQRRAIFSIYEPSPTIRGVNRPVPKTYQQHANDAGPVTPDLRPLTTRERSQIQTFPSDFYLDGTKTDIETMIGNAVPVKLAQYVANCILAYQGDKQANCVRDAVPQQLPLF